MTHGRWSTCSQTSCKTKNEKRKMEKIDYVLTYVDNTDPEWIEQNIKVSARFGRKYIPNGVRYRDWGTLRYVFRGLEENMPWINNVYIIVERPTQVPVWLNTNTVKVIYHNQIIPKQFLPTYNSNSIELFMYRIPTLSERFIYGNDDIFPTNPLAPEDFFTENGKVKIKMSVNRTYTVSHSRRQRILSVTLSDSRTYSIGLCVETIQSTLCSNRYGQRYGTNTRNALKVPSQLSDRKQTSPKRCQTFGTFCRAIPFPIQERTSISISRTSLPLNCARFCSAKTCRCCV